MIKNHTEILAPKIARGIFSPASALILCLAINSHALAGVILIKNGGLETNFGNDHTNSQLDATNAIHLALASAESGDIIEIRDDTPYILTNNHGYAFDTPNVTLRGGSGFNPTIQFNASGTNAFFYVNASGIAIQNLTLFNDPEYGNYGVLFGSKTWGDPTKNADGDYFASQLTIDNVQFIDTLGAIISGSGNVVDLTFSNNTVNNTQYGLGKSGINFSGTNLITDNTFIDMGAGKPEAGIQIDQNLGSVSFINNSFTGNEGEYAIFSDVVSLTDPELYLSANSFNSDNGGTGAQLDTAPLGTGYAVGLAEAPNIPEPSGTILLIIGGLMLLSRSNRQLYMSGIYIHHSYKVPSKIPMSS